VHSHARCHESRTRSPHDRRRTDRTAATTGGYNRNDATSACLSFAEERAPIHAEGIAEPVRYDRIVAIHSIRRRTRVYIA